MSTSSIPGQTIRIRLVRQHNAATLVETIAWLSLLILVFTGSVLAGRTLRTTSKQTACAMVMQRMGEAQAIYAVDHTDHIPGLNTSGVGLRALQGSPPTLWQNSNLSIQPQDWMTPLLRQTSPLADLRSARLKEVFDAFACPEQVITDVNLLGFPADLANFQSHGPWQAMSYLMPMYFQYWGQAEQNTYLAPVVAAPQLAVRAVGAPTNWEVDVPSFSSKVSQVGPPSTKVFVADGTRYVTNNTIDMDVSILPNLFGAFGSSGAWWSGSTEYGPDANTQNWDGQTICEGSASQGRNLQYSYRHDTMGDPDSAMENQGTMNAVFYDGHVENLNDEASREISLWYPTGAIVSPNFEPCTGMTFQESGDVIP